MSVEQDSVVATPTIAEAPLPPVAVAEPVAAPAPVVAPEPTVPAGPTPADLAAAQTPVTPDEDRTEAERMDPVPTGPIVLANGAEIDIAPLNLRELMKLLKIITRGAGGYLETLVSGLDMSDAGAFGQTLMAVVVMSIPEAENETVQFIQAMSLPAGLDSMTNEERVEALRNLAVYLNNPPIDDVVSIIERIVRRESEDIRSLGKRLGTALKLTSRVEKSVPASQTSTA